jgi:hypothetical protein
MGTWLENLGQTRSSTSGATNGFEIIPYIGVGLEYNIAPQFLFSPEIGWVIQRTEDEVSKNIFFLRGDFSYQVKKWLKLKLGSTFIMQTYSGDGGEDTLPNGDSQEVYFIPEERRTAYNQTLDIGVEFIKKNKSIRLQNYIYAWNQDEERMTSYSLSFNYFIPLEDLL